MRDFARRQIFNLVKHVLLRKRLHKGLGVQEWENIYNLLGVHLDKRVLLGITGKKSQCETAQ